MDKQLLIPLGLISLLDHSELFYKFAFIFSKASIQQSFINEIRTFLIELTVAAAQWVNAFALNSKGWVFNPSHYRHKP